MYIFVSKLISKVHSPFNKCTWHTTWHEAKNSEHVFTQVTTSREMKFWGGNPRRHLLQQLLPLQAKSVPKDYWTVVPSRVNEEHDKNYIATTQFIWLGHSPPRQRNDVPIIFQRHKTFAIIIHGNIQSTITNMKLKLKFNLKILIILTKT